MNLLNILMLMPPASEGGKQQNPMQMFIMLALIIVVFYFFMIRPQVKRQKELKNFRDSLEKGDKIITTGGIYGKISGISDNIVSVDVGNGVILKIDKSAIVKDVADLQNEQQKK
ncbi:MAG: preprotein translocase subunit YajC [Bacteroidales bacterium]|nr:preprotein translocase subunit YajC [Bacteroidales bacterium]MBN2819670.1 preprotein translocase subunit YajC [Bacteroidales bacterium]